MKNLTCIICPRGCTLTVNEVDGILNVSGNACPKGEKYAIDECTHPTRTVTSIIRINNRNDTMVSVKTENPIPKENIFDVMEIIRKTEFSAPVNVGDIIIKDVFGTNIIATKRID